MKRQLDLNTSHVKVQYNKRFNTRTNKCNLNTSHVKVQLIAGATSHSSMAI